MPMVRRPAFDFTSTSRNPPPWRSGQELACRVHLGGQTGGHFVCLVHVGGHGFVLWSRSPHACGSPPVLPLLSLELTWGSEQPGIEVESRPLQSKRFTAAQSERKSDDEACAIAAMAGDREHALGLGGSQRHDLVLIEPLHLRELRWIPGQVFSVDRNRERRLRSAMNLVHCSRLRTCLGHLRVDLLEVFRFELAELVRAASRNQVLIVCGSIPGQRAFPHGRRRHILDPLAQPLLNRPRVRTGLRCPAIIALTFKFADPR